jgi:hypothetical protein
VARIELAIGRMINEPANDKNKADTCGYPPGAAGYINEALMSSIIARMA